MYLYAFLCPVFTHKPLLFIATQIHNHTTEVLWYFHFIALVHVSPVVFNQLYCPMCVCSCVYISSCPQTFLTSRSPSSEPPPLHFALPSVAMSTLKIRSRLVKRLCPATPLPSITTQSPSRSGSPNDFPLPRDQILQCFS